MNCEKCGSVMTKDFDISRGRHVKSIYKCVSCGFRKMKRGKLISNKPKKK